jgi:putative hydrolase of the HAD superfamily
MTNTSILTLSGADALDLAGTIDAVLFDLSGTLLDEGYARRALAAAATAMSERWGFDRDAAVSDIRQALAAVSAAVADRRFYLMRDVMCAVFERVIRAHGHRATTDELVALDRLMWSVAIPTAVAAEGAIETIAALRSAGIRTGIVSYADIGVFEGLLQQTGLAGLTDIEVCSEMARSCKPDPAIFRMALEGIGVAPARAMFVGDSVESDVVGGNRVGMRTVLLSGRKFAIGTGSSDDPITHPDYHTNHLADVLDLLDGAPRGHRGPLTMHAEFKCPN